jgi:uncharacterized protein (DUF1015 family)
MVGITGLTGLRAAKKKIAEVTTPPYDVIDPGSKLEALLKERVNSLWHIILGENPNLALEMLIHNNILQEDNEPCFYVYEQTWEGNGESSNTRTGVFAAAEVSDYSEKQIIDHEEVNNTKVEERRKLAEITGYSFGPVFTLTESKISGILDRVKNAYKSPEYEFSSDFNGLSDMHGISNRVWRIKTKSREGSDLIREIGKNPLYIADGHHRYKVALVNTQSHFLTYICEAGNTKIQAYNRAINLDSSTEFDEIKNRLDLKETSEFKTPPKDKICVYAGGKTYLWDVKDKSPDNPDDLVGKLDISILENTIYRVLNDYARKSLHFDVYPESRLGEMKKHVDIRRQSAAFALSPVLFEEFKNIADAGLKMPSKSTYFYPKILSGIFMMENKSL